MRKAVYYVQYFNPAALPPLEHSALILQRAGYRISFAGVAEAEGAGRIKLRADLSSRVVLWRARQPGWAQKTHYFAFLCYHLWRIVVERPTWIYASDYLVCPLAYAVKLLRIGAVIYHEHDSPDASGVAGGWINRRLLDIRRMVARSADLAILPNSGRASIFDRLRPGCPPAQVVWNCPQIEEVTPARPPWNGGVLKLLYHGSIVPERLPLSVIDAVARFAGRVSLSVVGYFPASVRRYADCLRGRANELGVGSSVEIVGVLDRLEMLKFAASHDVGLAFMPAATSDVNMQHMTGASNKAFDYLAVGVALLVSDLPDWGAMYVDPGYAFACDPSAVDSVAAGLQRFLDDPVLMRVMGELGRRRILKDWNYEAEFAPVRNEMEKMSPG